jgi:hypothetical protein
MGLSMSGCSTSPEVDREQPGHHSGDDPRADREAIKLPRWDVKPATPAVSDVIQALACDVGRRAGGCGGSRGARFPLCMGVAAPLAAAYFRSCFAVGQIRQIASGCDASHIPTAPESRCCCGGSAVSVPANQVDPGCLGAKELVQQSTVGAHGCRSIRVSAEPSTPRQALS